MTMLAVHWSPEALGTPPRPPVAPPGEQLPPHADLPTLRAGVRDRHHSRAVWGVLWGVPESAGGGG